MPRIARFVRPDTPTVYGAEYGDRFFIETTRSI
jgi:hypothetical protein